MASANWWRFSLSNSLRVQSGNLLASWEFQETSTSTKILTSTTYFRFAYWQKFSIYSAYWKSTHPLQNLPTGHRCQFIVQFGFTFGCRQTWIQSEINQNISPCHWIYVQTWLKRKYKIPLPWWHVENPISISRWFSVITYHVFVEIMWKPHWFNQLFSQ